MKKIVLLCLLGFFYNNVSSQCDIVYLKADGYVDVSDNCIKLLKYKYGFSSKQLNKKAKKDKKTAIKAMNLWIKEYGDKKMTEAKAHRKKRWAKEREEEREQRIVLQIQTYQNKQLKIQQEKDAENYHRRANTKRSKQNNNQRSNTKLKKKSKPCRRLSNGRLVGDCTTKQ